MTEPTKCPSCDEPAKYCRDHSPRVDRVWEHLHQVRERADRWQNRFYGVFLLSFLLSMGLVFTWIYWPSPSPVWKRVPTIAQVMEIHDRVHPDCVAEVTEDIDVLEQMCAPHDMMRCDPVPTLEEMCPMCPQSPTPTEVRWDRLKADLKGCRADVARNRKGWNKCVQQWDRVCDQCWVWGKGNQSEEQLLCKGCE